MESIIDQVWDELKSDIARLKSDVAALHNTTEQAGYSDGIPAYAFANLPASGLGNGTGYITLAWVTNGRKAGESAGNGTGVLAIYNNATSTWKRVGEDYNDVTI